MLDTGNLMCIVGDNAYREVEQRLSRRSKSDLSCYNRNFLGMFVAPTEWAYRTHQ